MQGDPTVEAFQDWLQRRGRGRSATQYGRVIRRYQRDSEAFETQISDRRYSPNYRRHLAACLRAWAKYTKDNDLRDWLEELKLPAAVPRDVREPFPKDEWFAILDEIETADYLTPPVRAVCLIISTRGIRGGDVVRLTKREIQTAIKTGTLGFEGKGERRTEFTAAPVAEFLQDLLELPWGSHKRVRNLVSPRSRDEERAQDTATKKIRTAFDDIAEVVDIPPAELHAHKFRHTYATHFLGELEGDPEALIKLKEQMGWARLDTALNYLRRSRQGELDQVEQSLFANRAKPRPANKKPSDRK